MDFESPIRFAEYLLKAMTAEVVALHEGLELVGKLVEKQAKKEIGHLQPAIGPFAAWEELADSTFEDKERSGYLFNGDGNPLLRAGELQASIGHSVGVLEVEIGSTSQIAVYQELGTSTIPPRSFLGSATYHSLDKIKEIVGLSAVSGIIGSKAIPWIE